MNFHDAYMATPAYPGPSWAEAVISMDGQLLHALVGKVNVLLDMNQLYPISRELKTTKEPTERALQTKLALRLFLPK